jgi:FkbM family methyltransferase
MIIRDATCSQNYLPLKMIKNIVRSVLNYIGVVAFKRSSRVYIPEDESYRIVAALAGRPDPVVIDGGAHLGDMPERFGALLPAAEFHCFEPDPTLWETLKRKFAGNPRVHVVQAALGDVAGKAQFNINVSRPTNSLLPSSESLQPDLKQLCETVEQVEAEIVTIDEYCRANSIERVDVIKLDLQGYDYLALKGAEAMLKKAGVVLVEVLFKEIYKGCHGFPDILDLMRESDFYLYTLCGLRYGADSQLHWADAIFVKKDHLYGPPCQV